jgi:hypothetical protein
MTNLPTQTTAPSDFLLNFVVMLIAPIFLGVTGGDVALARMAALETINDYRARNHADLIAVAQIVGFGLAALGSLSLSMADDISLSMTLRLRGNAVSCNCAAEQNRKARLRVQAQEPRPAPDPEPQIAYDPPPEPEPEPFLTQDAASVLAAESQGRLQHLDGYEDAPAPTTAASRTPEEKRRQHMWAIAMAKEASEISASLPNLPPAERAAGTIRAAMLGSVCNDLIHGIPATPFEPGAWDREGDAAGNQPPA